MTDYKEKYLAIKTQLELLTEINEAQIKQYNRLQQKYDDVMTLTKRYSDHMEFCLQELIEENQELKSKLDNVKNLLEKYENEAN